MKQNKYTFIRYSNCWEDAEILLEGLNIKSTDIGLSICSGGDNTLAILTKGPKQVYAIDINKTQIYCLELKIASFKCFDYQQTLKFLGIIHCQNRVQMYNCIRAEISNEAKHYFDNNIGLIEKGIIHTGKFENYFKIFRQYIIPIITDKANFQEFSQISDLPNQVEFYEKKINNIKLKILFKVFFGTTIMGKLGRDRSFYKYVKDKKTSGADIKTRFEYGIAHTLNKTNPYINYIINGNYKTKSLPLYLKEENYEIIRNNLNKIHIANKSFIEVNKKKFDFFNLSDIFEYMSEQEFNDSIELLKRLSNINARIIYWNMQNKRYIQDKEFVLNKNKSIELFKRNKSWFYRDFLIYKLRGNVNE